MRYNDVYTVDYIAILTTKQSNKVDMEDYLINN